MAAEQDVEVEDELARGAHFYIVYSELTLV